jgi:integrase/recombinase XerC
MHTNSFLQYLQSEKRLSRHTIVAYTNDLEQFGVFLKTQHELADLTQADYQLIRSWLAHLMQNKISPRSVNRKIATLRSFYRYCIRQGIIHFDPMQKVKAPKFPQRLPVFIEAARLSELLDSDNFKNDYRGQRDRIIIELLYGTGIRLNELIHLRNQDVNLRNFSIKVTGKRNKQRIVPMHPRLSANLGLFQRAKDSEPVGNFGVDYLILTNKGNKAYPLFVYRTVSKYLEMITTQQKKSPHVLRHSFATSMLNNGAQLHDIKDILGHTSLAATQVYTHNTIERIKRIYQQAHPKA